MNNYYYYKNKYLEMKNNNLNNQIERYNIELNSDEYRIFNIKDIKYGIEYIEEIDDEWEITRRPYYKYYDIFKLNYYDSNKVKLIIRYIDCPQTYRKSFHTIIYDNDGKILHQDMLDDSSTCEPTVIIKLFNNKVIINRGRYIQSHTMGLSKNIFSTNSYKVEIDNKKIEWGYIPEDSYLFEKKIPESYYNYCCNSGYDD